MSDYYNPKNHYVIIAWDDDPDYTRIYNVGVISEDAAEAVRDRIPEEDGAKVYRVVPLHTLNDFVRHMNER